MGGEDLDTRGVVAADDAPPLPAGLAATGWLVADADTGTVLAARDPHGRFYPASTLKTLTLLTLLPLLDPAEVVTGTAEDEQVEGSRVGIVTGGRYSVGLLFQALMLQSGNDAANALARAAGGVEETVAAMNETAEELGAFDTVAGSPSGLDVTGQSSSPYDLALVFRALVDEPAAAAILRTPTAQMPAVARPLRRLPDPEPGPAARQLLRPARGKTGFTDAARHTFVGAAQRGDRTLVVSVMNTENRPLRAADQAALLLDWGFALPDDVEGVGELVEPGEVPAEVTPTPTASPSTAIPVGPPEPSAPLRPPRGRLPRGAARPGRDRGAHRGGDADRSSARAASARAAVGSVGAVGSVDSVDSHVGSTGAGVHGTDTASTDQGSPSTRP